MPMSAASSNANNGLFVCNIQITLFIAVLIVELPEVTPRTYLSEEPGTLDPSVHKPAHHMRKFQVTRRPLEEIPIPNNTVVTGLVGTKSILECHTRKIVNITVEWYKYDHNNKSQIKLVKNNETLTDDKRFLSVESENSMIWYLHIRFATKSDEGLYECRVYNETIFSIFTTLDLYEARASILGPDIREVDKGFPIRLSCIINLTDGYHKPHHSNIMIQPRYMFWYRDNRVINYDLKDGAVVHEGELATELIFQRALPQHTGNYTCVPSNARQASVQVIVHYRGEEFPSQKTTRDRPKVLAVIVVLFIIAII
ncbi:protein turtle-like [Anthonomus grandis grandis]|uniref:protein turtle-like n=1 Tax=Anthonomus grandis grandis TaxID=2921223 RepID=UPI0021652C5E|nr:protein turtle-like [Anthonomus grandis grandis]